MSELSIIKDLYICLTEPQFLGMGFKEAAIERARRFIEQTPSPVPPSVIKPRDGLPVPSQEASCTCLHTESGVMFVNSLCPIHGDARDTGIIELCDLCGRPLPTDTHWVHTECADAENARP